MTLLNSKQGRWLVLAFALGLLIRLVTFTQTVHLGTEIYDEQDYSKLAGNIIGGVGYAWDAEHPTSLRPPLFPGLVAAVWTVTGVGNLQAVRAVQIALAILASFVLYQIGVRCFSPEAGAIAAALFWLYPSLIFFNFTILTETLFTTLLLCFLLFSIMLLQQPRAWVAIACGLALGLAALTRSVLWPMPLVFCPLIMVLLEAPVAKRVMLAVLLLVGYGVVVVPWAVRNTRVQGTVTIVDTMSGVNLRTGNYEFTPDERMWDGVSLLGEKSWAYELSQEQPGVRFTEGQKDKWAQRKGFEYIAAHPAQTIRRSFIKFADFWGLEREYMAGIQQGLFAPPRVVAFTAPVLIVLAYALVVMIGAAGMWLAPAAWRFNIVLLLPVAVLTAAHTLTFGHSRYHIPLIPIFCLYGAALLTSDRPAWIDNRIGLSGAALCALVFVTIWGRQILLVDAARILSFF